MVSDYGINIHLEKISILIEFSTHALMFVRLLLEKCIVWTN